MIVPVDVEIQSGNLSLADLLMPDTCSELRQAAAQLPLGATPLPGSVRVLEGREVRSALQKLVGSEPGRVRAAGMQVPERISVRRSGAHITCQEIAAVIEKDLRKRQPGKAGPSGQPIVGDLLAEGPSKKNLDCSAAAHVPQGVSLEVANSSWDQALRSWNFSLHCLRPGECVPFLVRLPSQNPALTAGRNSPATARVRTVLPVLVSGKVSPQDRERKELGIRSQAAALVKSGQTATLIWDQEGIRLTLPVVCLEPGEAGQFVRTRLKGGGRIVRAQVMSTGMLRAAS